MLKCFFKELKLTETLTYIIFNNIWFNKISTFTADPDTDEIDIKAPVLPSSSAHTTESKLALPSLNTHTLVSV